MKSRWSLKRTVRSWETMKYRCNDSQRKDYGGRGISYQPSWEAFDNFFNDMGERPDGMELDRRDNNGNYTKENCRWVTRQVNIQNTRTTKLTPTKVLHMRALAKQGKSSVTIAELFNVSKRTTNAILAGTLWNNVI